MAYILFDDTFRAALLPFTFTRPTCDLRVGIYTFRERWQRLLQEQHIPVRAYGYIHDAMHETLPQGDAIWLNSRLAPDAELLKHIQDLPPNSYVHADKHVLAARFETNALPADYEGVMSVEVLEQMDLKAESADMPACLISKPTDIFQQNKAFILYDFELAIQDGPSQKIDDKHSMIYGADNVYLAPGASIKGALIDAEAGPIYIGPNAQIQLGANIQGVHAIGQHAVVNMGAKLRGDSAFGPYVKVGGEVGNSVIMGFSSKGHDGYMGNSVLGYWCNIGADTNTSNLKNNYDEVKLWSYETGRFQKTGTIFCGLMMGDHSKAGINTMFNTGTVIGVGSNIYGTGYPRNFVPSFSWGGAAGMVTHRLDKMLKTAEIVMGRRSRTLTEAESQILDHVFKATAEHRRWEK
ncbi:MAG: putative sugar nucleotidyl transferase [Bacteroidia bacterium]